METRTIVPFENGTQFDDWCASNCERCEKSTQYSDGAGCELEDNLLLACFDDGKIDATTAQRIGMNESTKNRYTWPCGEVDWTEEWKAECRLRHPEACDHKTATVINDTEAVCTWGCGQTVRLGQTFAFKPA